MQGQLGSYVVKDPMVSSHECAGQAFNTSRCSCSALPDRKSHLLTVCHREVVEVGSAVTNLRRGDKVALEPGIPCWSHKMSRQATASKKLSLNSVTQAVSYLMPILAVHLKRH